MKTCHFRGGQPRSINHHKKEGILCEIEPSARYGMKPCDQCQHHGRLPIQYSENYSHQFCNGYKTILNCPAVNDGSISFLFFIYPILLDM